MTKNSSRITTKLIISSMAVIAKNYRNESLKPLIRTDRNNFLYERAMQKINITGFLQCLGVHCSSKGWQSRRKGL